MKIFQVTQVVKMHFWVLKGPFKVLCQLSFNIIKISSLTLWHLKNVLRDICPRPICENIWNTFVADPPTSRMLRHRRKFPAGIWVPGISGWLYQVFSLLHAGLLHVVLITASVPIFQYHLLQSMGCQLCIRDKTWKGEVTETGIQYVWAPCANLFPALITCNKVKLTYYHRGIWMSFGRKLIRSTPSAPTTSTKSFNYSSDTSNEHLLMIFAR